jgi:hypothetical protein
LSSSSTSRSTTLCVVAVWCLCYLTPDTLLTPLRSLQLVYVPIRTGRCSCATMTRPAHRQTRD